MENKLTISHLAPYLPYGLKMRFENITGREITLTGIHGGDGFAARISDGRYGYWLDGCGFKPILRPLQQFTSINSPAMSELNCDMDDQIQITELADARRSYYSLSWSAMEACFRNHVDVFDLIGKGLAIEKGARA